MSAKSILRFCDMEQDFELTKEESAFGSPDDRLGDKSVTENWSVPVCSKGGHGGSKGVTELTGRELWSERRCCHFMLQRNSKVLHVTVGSEGCWN